MENLNLESAIPSVVLHDSDEGIIVKIRDAYEYYLADNPQEALNILESDSNLGKLSYVQLLIGNCYRSKNNIDKAMQCWRKALEISPDEAMAHLNIGSVFYSQNDFFNAIENWTAALMLMPENPTVNLNLAVAYNNKNCRIKATKFFENYLKYCRENSSKEYLSVKETMLRLRSKVDFYFRKLSEVKEQGDLRAVVTVYGKLISTYANLPSVYLNLGNIFLFDKNNEKALEFFLTVFKNFEYTNQLVWTIASLYEALKQKSYAYCYYKRCEEFIPKTSSKYKTLVSKLQSLSFSVKTDEAYSFHLENAREYEKQNLYEEALVEYENCSFLASVDSPEVLQKIQKFRIYTNPIPFAISELCSQVNECMDTERLSRCIDLCDRIIILSDINSKEGMFAVRCKTECKRIMMTRHSREVSK